MTNDEDGSKSTGHLPKNELLLCSDLNPRSLLDRVKALENQAERLNRLADAIESLAASNFQTLQVLLDIVAPEGDEQSQENATLDG